MDEFARYTRFHERAKAIGLEAAYLEVYGKSDETPKEYARRLRKLGLTIRTIAAILRLRYGYGSKSVVHRWVNQKAFENHRKCAREWYRKSTKQKRVRNARKYARNLATRGFPLEEIQRRVSEKYSGLAQQVKGWVSR